MAHLGNTVVNGALRVLGGEYVDSINTGSSLTIGALEVKGIIAGDSGSTGHGLYGGGGYHNAYNNILLHGDSSTATSGIAFMSDKVDSSGTVTNVNQPSDRAFIQYHACGITTATAEGTNPTLATSGENGRLVIGIGNDATDQVWLQTPGRTGLIHQVGNTSYVIPDTNNTTGSVGSATQPSYVEGGVIKACTYSLNKTVPADAKFTDTNTTYTFANGTNGFTVTPSGGTAQTVTVTPSITNNVTGSGTSGYIAKFNGANTITNGPAFGSATTTYLRNDGTWATPPDTKRINGISWPAPDNLICTASANSQEWSIDLTPGTYTGSYFHIWSAKNSKSILQCYTDSNTVQVPSGDFKVTGGKSYNRVLSNILTGTGTAAQDKGADADPRYFPARWAFNIGIATPANGDIVTIKIPCAGHDYGVFVSLDNGTTYKPVSVNYSTGRLTTHFGNGTPLTLIYDSAGQTNDVIAAAGANARSNISGGCWRVMNFYDTNTNNSVTQTATTTDANYEVLFSVTADNTTRTEGARKNSNLKFNPSTGNLQATQLNGVAIGSSPKFTDNDTKNTAGSTDSSSKLFLIGATSQAANPQTYSHDTAYVGTDGCLYSGGTKVLTAHQSLDPIKHTNTDIPEGAANLSATATAHKITAYRNGLTIPYKADNTNDGGMLRVRGTTESDCILELGTWDDSGGGETIQFNYYPTNSQVTPTYSVSVPKKSGTIALTSDIPGVVSTSANGLAPKVTDTSKFLKGDGTWATPTNTTYTFATGDSNGQIKVTPSGGTAQNVSVKGLGSNAYTSTSYLPTGGGTMTGQLKTSFNSSVAMGSYQPNSTTIANLCNELRYSSGCCGSFSLNTAYTLNNVTLATGWYNFLWIPHRSGGVNGAASGDNCNYGCMYITGMTVGGSYVLRYSGSAIADLYNLHPDRVKYSSSVSAAVNATTCTISDGAITTSSMIEPFSSNAKGNVITITKMVVTAGQVVLTFPALSDATSFKVRITN